MTGTRVPTPGADVARRLAAARPPAELEAHGMLATVVAGYGRMLQDLFGEIAERDRRIAELEAQLARAGRPDELSPE